MSNTLEQIGLKTIDIVKFGEWQKSNRDRLGWSLEVLGRKLDRAGYPVSNNKLWRIENTDKRPLKKLDNSLKLALEEVFGEQFGEDKSDIKVSLKEILYVIQEYAQKPDNEGLMGVYKVIKKEFSK